MGLLQYNYSSIRNAAAGFIQAHICASKIPRVHHCDGKYTWKIQLKGTRGGLPKIQLVNILFGTILFQVT